MANEFSRFNSAITGQRRQTLKGVYDVHTNFLQYPKIMQPTHARWEHIPSQPANSQALQNEYKYTGDSLNGGGAIFAEMPPVYTRKFMISDTYYETPPTSTLGYPGPDEALPEVGPPGLSHVSNDIITELPTACRQAFFKARAQEIAWKRKWYQETDGRAKAQLNITYNV